MSENRARRVVAARGRRPRPHLRTRGAAAQGAGRETSRSRPSTTRSSAIAAATRAGTTFVFGYLGGGPLPFDLRRRAPISSWRFQALADRAGDERAHHAAVLLAHPAADRARLRLAAGTHLRRRRRSRPLHRRQHLPRHGRGAAVHPPVSRAGSRAANCSW